MPNFGVGNKLFIPRKAEPTAPTNESYGVDMRAIEEWANRFGGGFPNFTGQGSPNGVINGQSGQWYEDLSGAGGLYVFVGTNGTNTGWMQIGGRSDAATGAGITGVEAGGGMNIVIASQRPEPVVITDIAAISGHGNGFFWNTGTADGLQTISIRLGNTGQFIYKFQIDALGLETAFQIPGTSGALGAIFVNAGDPNGVVTSLDTGDLCIDVSTPALWQATSVGTVWTTVGGGGGGGYASLTGPGTGTTPDSLTQAGGFTVDDTALGQGITLNSTGTVFIQGQSALLADTGGGTSVGGSQLGFYSTTPVNQPSAIAHPTGGATVDTQARAAIVSILNAIGEAAGGIGITA